MIIVMDFKDYTLTQFLSDSSFRTKMAKIWSVSVARLSRLRLAELWLLHVTKLWLASVAKLWLVRVAKLWQICFYYYCQLSMTKLWLVSVAKQTVECGKFVVGKCCKTAS